MHSLLYARGVGKVRSRACLCVKVSNVMLCIYPAGCSAFTYICILPSLKRSACTVGGTKTIISISFSRNVLLGESVWNMHKDKEGFK